MTRGLLVCLLLLGSLVMLYATLRLVDMAVRSAIDRRLRTIEEVTATLSLQRDLALARVVVLEEQLVRAQRPCDPQTGL